LFGDNDVVVCFIVTAYDGVCVVADVDTYVVGCVVLDVVVSHVSS